MTLSRRGVLRAAAWGTGGLALSALRGLSAATPAAATGRPGTTLPALDDPRFPTPLADPLAIPRFVNALPRPARISLLTGGRRRLVMGPTVQDVLGGGRGLAPRLWGYGEGRPGFPGPTLVARSHQPATLTWVNQLPFAHLLPLDPTVHWAFTDTGYSIAEHGVPAVVHLHGGHNDAGSDGHPDAWYTRTGVTGPRFTGTRYRYGNTQEAATLWYHDHTLGLTRLNVYAGLAGLYLLRDDHELALIEDNRLPHGRYELELVLQDRMFQPDGSLAYPGTPVDASEGTPAPRLETFGQVILVNGMAWPRADLEPRQYRLRVLNASNSRFFRLSVHGSWPFPVHLIGTEGGFLARPLALDAPLLLGPAERADLVIDLRGTAGTDFDLTNDAPTPYPDGDPVAPPADQVLRFSVNQPTDAAVPEPRLPARLRPQRHTVPGPVARTRRLLLFEGTDELGRFRPLLGTVEQGALAWSDPVTEEPGLGTAEVWELFNTTGTSHPVHLHLVRFQVLDRAPFTATQDPATGALSDIRVGVRRPAAPTEQGPKDTVVAAPGEVTRIRACFDRPGPYVWHCQILEHEDHDMMRAFRVGLRGAGRAVGPPDHP